MIHTFAVTALGLIDLENDSSKTTAYSTLIQTFNRYLLEQMTTESSLPPNIAPSPSPLLKNSPFSTEPGKVTPPMAQLVKLDLKTLSTCSSCGAKGERETGANVIDLIYPRRVSLHLGAHHSSFR
jgi:PAB-dependent poly(A)-specific ribonuclease subunit 2